MHRALSSFDVMVEGRRLGLVQEDKSGWWKTYGADRGTIGSYATSTAAREAIVQQRTKADSKETERKISEEG